MLNTSSWNLTWGTHALEVAVVKEHNVKAVLMVCNETIHLQCALAFEWRWAVV